MNEHTASKLPTYFISHGGGPWPWIKEFMPWDMSVLERSLQAMPREIGVTPRAILVISGHYDDKKGPAVFYKLGKLKVGDTLKVIDSGDQTHAFQVIEVASYSYTKAPLNRIFGFDLQHDLNLITCDGRWNARTHTYNQRLVVYTRLIEN